MSFSKACVYDNPDTMARECWINGKLIMQYSAEYIMLKERPLIIHIANIGDWEAGKFSGNKLAMKSK